MASALIAAAPTGLMPGTPAARDAFDRGRTAFGRAEYARAIEILHPLLYPEVILDSEGEVVQARRMLGVAYLFENKPEDARREFHKLLELRPDYRFDPLLDPQRVVRMMGPRLTGIVDVLRRRGLIAMTAMRLVPLAPFVVEGLAAGALRIRLWHFAAGSAIGMAPGTLAATVFSREVEALLDKDAPINWPLIAAMAALLAAGTWWVRRWFVKQQAAAT